MASTRILCFDLNNGQMTFKSKKVNFQGHGPADHDPMIFDLVNGRLASNLIPISILMNLFIHITS